MPATTRTVHRLPPSSVPGQLREPGFHGISVLFDTSSTVHLRSSSQHLPDEFGLAFSDDAHDPGHWTDAARGGLNPDPVVRVRGAVPHRVCSKAASIRPSLHHGLLSAPSWRKPSSGGESHPSALTEPDVTLSRHPARPVQPHGFASGISSSPCGLTGPFGRTARPLGSPCVLRVPRYYGPVRPSPRIGTLLLVGLPLGVLPSHRGAGSHVPHTRLSWAHAVCMPATTRPVHRPAVRVLSQANFASLVSMASACFSTRPRRFTCVRLPSTYLTSSVSPFPRRSRPRPLDRRRSWWFGF